MIDRRRSCKEGTHWGIRSIEQQDIGNHDRDQSNLSRTQPVSKLQYHIMNYNSNIILVSAAVVLLVTNIYTCQTTIGTHQLVQAFEPTSKYTHTHRHCRWNNLVVTPSITSIQLSPLIRHTTNAARKIPSLGQLYATEEKRPQSTWSRSATVTSATSEHTRSRRRESRIGVRRRVKSVLKKARKRTGIRNNSDDEDDNLKNGRRIRSKSSIQSVVADAASIGGLGAVIVDEETGEFDVAFDYIPPIPKENGKVKDKESASDVTESAYKNLANGKTVNGSSSPRKKTPPASTYSPPIIIPEACPDEALVVASPVNATKSSASKQISTSSQTAEIDVFKSDVSAAFSLPPPPLPFSLPRLNRQQKELLLSGERVQFQSEMGREGSGFVVVDVKAPESVVWNCLLDFKSYPETIPTVQKVLIEDSGNLDYGTSGLSRATFTLSKKLRLRVSVVHKYKTHPCGDHLIFELDERSKNFVLNKAKGVWYTESKADGLEPGFTRVWLLAELKVSPILPRMIVDYAARKAFPRATSWIKPHVETAASLWLKPDEEKADT